MKIENTWFVYNIHIHIRSWIYDASCLVSLNTGLIEVGWGWERVEGNWVRLNENGWGLVRLGEVKWDWDNKQTGHYIYTHLNTLRFTFQNVKYVSKIDEKQSLWRYIFKINTLCATSACRQYIGWGYYSNIFNPRKFSLL